MNTLQKAREFAKEKRAEIQESFSIIRVAYCEKINEKESFLAFKTFYKISSEFGVGKLLQEETA